MFAGPWPLDRRVVAERAADIKRRKNTCFLKRVAQTARKNTCKNLGGFQEPPEKHVKMRRE